LHRQLQRAPDLGQRVAVEHGAPAARHCAQRGPRAQRVRRLLLAGDLQRRERRRFDVLCDQLADLRQREHGALPGQ